MKAGLLEPALIARLSGLRLATRRRVTGRYAGGHRSKRHGSSLEFADYREYVAGDDPRRVDLSAYRRLGKLLVKLTEAEDEAPLRVVLDHSRSMAFGSKGQRARELAAALTVLGTAGADPVRILLAGTARDPLAVDPGPWMRGRSALPIAVNRLLAAVPEPLDPEDDVAPTDPTRAIVDALHRAHGEGARGPVLLISDLLFDGFDAVLRALAGRGGDAVLVHLLGREDLEPTLRGDLRLVDVETGLDVEVAIDERGLAAYAAGRDLWLDEVDETAGRHGITVVRVIDDQPLEDVLLTGFRAAGIVA